MQARRVNTIVERLTLLLGAVVFLLAFPHAFLGWPALSNALIRSGVEIDLRNALGAGWIFGSLCMAAFGIVVMLAVGLLRRGIAMARWIVVTIGSVYLAFGVGAGLHHGFGPHFVTFAAIGTLLCALMALWHR